jgi:hypothetical protein
MSIAQNLRILNKPISELAMLPQETIMTMAQSGQIPVAFVAPILAEKAEASQRAVEVEAMMAQEQMPPGSVIEKIIAQNAANEAQTNMPMMAPPMPEAQDNMPMMGAQMPQMPQMPQMSQMSQMPQPEDVGIGALPVPDEMIPGLAGGGIIAFKTGDLVKDESDPKIYSGTIGANPNKEFSLDSPLSGLEEEAERLKAAKAAFVGPNQSVSDLIAYNKEAEKRAAERAKSQFNTRLGIDSLDSPFSGLKEEAKRLKAAKEAFLGPNQSVSDLIAYNKEAEKRAAERAKSQFNTRLIEAGLLGLSGDSPYFGVNMGRMAPAVKGMSEDTEKQAEAKEARIKSVLAAKGIERKEGEATFTGALAAQQAKIEADRRAKEAGLDRTSRENVAELDRKTRLEVANSLPDAIRGARAIMMPGESLGDALSRYAEITNTKDQYNAASSLVKVAFEAGSKRFENSIGGSGGNYNLSRAAGGDKEAQDELKMTQEEAEKELKRIKEVYLKEAYSDVGMAPEIANLYLRAPKGSAVNNPLSVTAPDGKTYSFPTKEKADEFRRKIQGQ